MAQHDYNIANQSFPSFRSDLNNALSAIQTTNSGTSLPTGAVAGQIWLDTTNATSPTLKIYDGTDSISLAIIDYTTNTVNWLDSSLSYNSTATSAGTLTLTVSSSYKQYFTGTTTHTVTLPVASTLTVGQTFEIHNNSTGSITVNSSGSNLVGTVEANVTASITCILASGTTAASWDFDVTGFTSALPTTRGGTGLTSIGTSLQVLRTNTGATGLEFANAPTGFRNIIINGDMQIAQRSTSVASITTGAYHTLDRWYFDVSSLGTFTMSQSTDVPSGYGFGKSLKLDNTTADASPSAGDYMILSTRFEGQNLQYLKKGTANAQSLTLSFWVKSTKTGTFIVELSDNDNGRTINKSYTVSVTNTWEFKTITFAGDTTGAFDNDNALSLYVNFWLGAGTTFSSGTLQTSWAANVTANRAVGQVNIADNTANDFLITGVQLEAGTSATDFEFLPIDVSLGRCFRYFEKSYEYATVAGTATGVGAILGDGSYGAPTTFYLTGSYPYKIEKRANPTVVVFDSAGTSGKCNREWIGVSSSTNQDASLWSNNTSKKLTLFSPSGDNRTNISFQFTATAEL